MFKKIGVKNTFRVWLILTVFFTPVFSFGATIYSTDAGGNWNDINSWIGGIVPVESDDVILKSTIKFPAILKIKSIKLDAGIFIFRNINIETEDFEIGTNAILKTYKQAYGAGHILNIKTNNFINNGTIQNYAKINLNGNFINNGQILSTVSYGNTYYPEIKIQGNIENNVILDDSFYFILLPNTFSKKYRIYGNERISLKLESSGDYYFKGDLDFNYFWTNLDIIIHLDENRIFSTQFIWTGSTIVFPNKNRIILNKKIPRYSGGVKINALDSDIYFNDNLKTNYIKAKNVYLNNSATVTFSEGGVNIDKIIISEFTKLTLDGGSWYGRNNLNMKANIENHGTLYFASTNIIQGDVFNYGLISQGTPLYATGWFKLKGDLYNYQNGVIDKSFLLVPKNSSSKILNLGNISELYLIEDIEFDPGTTFNFNIKSYDKNIILSEDTVFNSRISGGGVNFISKNNEILNLKLDKNIGKIKNWEKFNLIFDNSDPINLTLSQESKFNKLIVSENSHINIYGEHGSWNRDYSYINGDIINNGEIDFKTNYDSLRSYFHKSIQNNGILLGKTAWAFPDGRNFRYIISENEVLTDVEKGELDNSSLVNKTINLVPRLSEMNKIYYIHLKDEGAVESVKESLNNGVSNPVTNFSSTNPTMPNSTNIPDQPEPGDRTKPVINLNGDSEINLMLGEDYIELNATAIDDIDGDLTSQIGIQGTVDTTVVGIYQINYSVSDLSGNRRTITRTVNVNPLDQTPPVITLIGDAIISLNTGDVYEEFGAIANDDIDGNLDSSIQISGTVDTTITGIYLITYTVLDSSNNTSFIQRTIKVTKGDSFIGTPSTTPKGKSGKKSSGGGKGSKKVETCKDSKALNFKNYGKHNQELCIYEKKEEFFSTPGMLSDCVPGLLCHPGGFEKVLSVAEKEKEEEVKEEKNEENKFLLISTCLNLESELKFLKKWNKDEKSNIKVQEFLKERKYLSGVVDGAYGAITSSSLKQFQSDNNLYSDGIFGQGTADFIDGNCEKDKIKNADYFEKKREDKKEEKKEEGEKEKEKIKEKEKQEITPQNPAPKKNEGNKKFDLEKKEKIISKNVKILKDWVKEGIEENKKETIGLSNNLKEIVKNSRGPGEAFGTVITLGIGGLYGTLNNIWNYSKISLIELRKIKEIVIKGKEKKEFFLKIHNKTATKEKSNGNKTYIIIHGWRSDPDSWVKEMADSLDDKRSQILLIDWQGITNHPVITEDTKSTEEVSIKIAEQLNNWGIDKDNTTIIGHSLGAMLGARISYHLGRVKRLVSLDTAELLATPYKFKITQDDKPFPGFKNMSQNTKCFVGTASVLGNENISEECNQTYKIDFPAKTFEHPAVHEIYEQILKRNTLSNNILTPKNTKYIPSGLIKAKDIDDVLKLSYLKTKTNKKLTFYGSEINNDFKCTNSITNVLSDFYVKENQICEFWGWKGIDTFKITKSSQESIFKDFKENDDSDILKIDNKYLDIFVEKISDKKTTLWVKFKSGWKDITLEGVSESDVKGWVEIADGSYRKTEEGRKLSKDKWEKKQEDNPIQIE